MVNTDTSFGTNAIRLTSIQWVWALVICAAIGWAIPLAWSKFERFDPGPDYRLPYRLSNDDWMFQRWCTEIQNRSAVAILGDSVIWGQYVAPDQTLSHYLNAQTGTATFANLGVDGIHPLAMEGLVRHHGRSIHSTAVLLQLNPLWSSSPERDLQADEQIRFNHPRLVPQIYPNLTCYRPTTEQIIDHLARRHMQLFSWRYHVRAVYFENMNLAQWTIEYPYTNPLLALGGDLPLPVPQPISRPVDWRTRKIDPQNLPWIDPDDSLQFSAMTRVIDLLRSRKNRVFVLLGPLNPHVLTLESRRRYNRVREKSEAWLQQNLVPYLAPSPLVSDQYADASHPLAQGYQALALQLWESNGLRQWLGKSGVGQ